MIRTLKVIAHTEKLYIESLMESKGIKTRTLKTYFELLWIELIEYNLILSLKNKD